MFKELTQKLCLYQICLEVSTNTLLKMPVSIQYVYVYCDRTVIKFHIIMIELFTTVHFFMYGFLSLIWNWRLINELLSLLLLFIENQYRKCKIFNNILNHMLLIST